jgi:4-amino-4-deoxy-L-arabinose transferase-like glycosyltransferase
VLTFISGLTVLFEIYTFREAADISSAVILVTMGCWLAGLSLLAARSIRHIQIAGAVLILVALLAVPFSWAALTTFNTNPDVALPTAGADGMSQTTFMTPNQELLDSNGQAILDYLLANTDPESYLLATNNARGAAPFILETDRAVFTFGGFTGGDNVIDLEGLLEMLESGGLRYILGLPQKQEIARWMQQSCEVVDVPGVRGQGEALYDCGN